ncbi:MAG: exopolysaccharide biosynthesis polyprenyl glycosylphosphotransferase [Frankiales bacterium]|nr:exopolysaccharide biosynthesis polyprenyl glycosylphosphotransferase [Frankiales bacterium]
MTRHAIPSEPPDLGLAPPVRPARPLWETLYAGALMLLDGIMITGACALGVALNFRGDDPTFRASLKTASTVVPYSLFVALIPPVWIMIIAASNAYEARFLGVGSEEFKRVANASTRFVALLAFVSYALKAQFARGFVAVVVPAGFVLLVLGRYAARKVLHELRHRHRCQHRVVLVGSPDEIGSLAEQMLREPYAGLDVVAVALPTYYTDRDVTVGGLTLPNIGPARDLALRLHAVGADTVAVAGTSAMSSLELRQLSWDLEGTNSDLLVAPAITDVTGPRIHIRPVAGLPLLHVEAPTFGGLPRVVKRIIDVIGSLILLSLLLVPFVVLGLLIRLESHGNPLFRQVRVGRDGSRFTILKFRSMRNDAEQALAELGALNESDGPLFKMSKDPRVTRIGSFLRRFSVDELPQLLNVLAGSMSLVGPRPPLPGEVDVYDEHVHRRLLVKPGMTGLWQVSGRSDLSWDESVRLDLYYVENWSVALDAQILWKTLFAVVGSRGAY